MKKCGVCGKRYRGAGSYVFVAVSLDPLGGLQRVRGCPSCTSQSIHLALPKRAVRCDCGAVATSCAGCENARAPKLRAAVVNGAVAKMRGMLRAYPKGNAFHAGLELAINVLSAGDWTTEVA